MASESQKDLLKKHFTTDDPLRIRQDIHDKYTVPDRSFAEWVLERIPWQGGERFLDVGCGNGLYYTKMKAKDREFEYVGMDLLAPMITHHPLYPERRLTLADAQKLPFPDNSFDVIMANHMMHHLDDIDAGLAEFQRVLAPGGILAVATNSMSTMPELQVLMRRAIVLLTRSGAATVRAPEMPTDRFALENGVRMLSKRFFAIVRHDLPSALVFPDVDPAMDYLETTRDLREPSLPDDVVWEDVMMIMRQQINQLIKHLGELVINKQGGVLIASRDGRFISDSIAESKTEFTQVFPNV
ncbi:MAG: class I SAM-dependent methyltransferase [Chloroflexota bacterium]